MKNAVKAVKFEAGEGENRLDRLPDALIVSIFNKLVHAKYLLRCFSVSKRFASLTRQTDTIFVPILMSSPVEQVPFRGLFDLKKFTSIRSLRIEISPSFDNNNNNNNNNDNNNGVPESLMKYKSVIGARLEILVAVFAMGVHNSGGAASVSGANYGNEVMEETTIMLTRSCLTNALGFHRWSQSPVLNLPKLCELVITCKRVGKVCLGKDQIVGLRNYLGVSGVKTELSESELIGDSGGVGVKIWHAPAVLELPSSGRVLEWATVVVVRPEGEEIVMVRDVDLIMSVFGGGEEDEEDDDDGKDIHEVLNVVRKKMVSDNKNVAFINTRILKLEEEEDEMNIL